MDPTSTGVLVMTFQQKIEKNSTIDIRLVRLSSQRWPKVDLWTVKLLIIIVFCQIKMLIHKAEIKFFLTALCCSYFKKGNFRGPYFRDKFKISKFWGIHFCDWMIIENFAESVFAIEDFEKKGWEITKLYIPFIYYMSFIIQKLGKYDI